MAKAPTVSCPRCGAPVEWAPAARFRPFCSERCKMMDLGAWATEKYKVAGADADDKREESSEPDKDRR